MRVQALKSLIWSKIIVIPKGKQLSKRYPNSSDYQISKKGDPNASIRKQQTLELNIKSSAKKADAKIAWAVFLY